MEKPQKRLGIISITTLLIFTGIVDVIQIILDLFVVGILINRILDIIIGIILIFWFFILRILTIRVAVGLGLSFIAEMIPILDIAPAWTLDVIYTAFRVNNEDKQKMSVFLAEQDAMGIANSIKARLGIINASGIRSNSKEIPRLNNRNVD